MALVGAAGVFALPAHADTEFNFDAVTSANGVTTALKNQSIPLGLTIQGDGPTAQAHLASLGQSDGFASFPYPGDTVVGLPGLIRAAILPGVPVPDYPFYVRSAYGSPPAGGSYPGGLELSSESTATRTDSRAVVASGSSGLVSESHVIKSDSDVTATSTAKANALVFSGVLELSGFSSTATVKVGSDGKLTRTSSLTIGRINVPGLSLTLPKQTPSQIPIPNPLSGLPQLLIPLPPLPLPLGGTTLPAPDIGFEDGQFSIQLPLFGGQKFALPAQTAFDALKAAGIDMSYQAPIKTATSITAPSLTFHTILPAPPANQFYSGPTDITYNTGVTASSIRGASVDLSGGNPGTGSSGYVPVTGDEPGSGGSTGGVGGAGTASPPIGAGAPAPGGGTAGSAPVVAPPTTPGVEAARLASVVGTPTRGSVFWFYIVLVGVGLAGTAGSQILRYLGVRASWSS